MLSTKSSTTWSEEVTAPPPALSPAEWEEDAEADEEGRQHSRKCVCSSSRNSANRVSRRWRRGGAADEE